MKNKAIHMLQHDVAEGHFTHRVIFLKKKKKAQVLILYNYQTLLYFMTLELSLETDNHVNIYSLCAHWCPLPSAVDVRNFIQLQLEFLHCCHNFLFQFS
jgi:hypothetical protein